MGYVIYEKNYPPIEWEKSVIQSGTRRPVPAFDAFYEKIMEIPEVCLIPERVASSKAFVETAIKISMLYQLDTKIMRHHNRITVEYSFCCGGGMIYLGQVLGMADEIAFLQASMEKILPSPWIITPILPYKTTNTVSLSQNIRISGILLFCGSGS